MNGAAFSLLASPDSSSAQRAEAFTEERWEWFVEQCVHYGACAERVRAEFGAQDRSDLVDERHDASQLKACARTIARDSRLRPDRRPSQETGACVRCQDCRHFERVAHHPHYGRCAEGVASSGLCGWWDSALHACERFAAIESPGSRS